MKVWYMEQPFHRLRGQLSHKDLIKLRRFYTVQLELSRALLAGKPLGICKITTSAKEASLDMYLEEEEVAKCILSNDASKEMFL